MTSIQENPVAVEDRAQRAYLAHFRHELYTPTEAILGYSEILVGEAQETAREPLLPDLRKIHRAGETLRELVNTLLDPAYLGRAAAYGADLETVAATIRHDLRTPLNAILGYSEMLMEEMEDGGGEDALLPDLRKLHAAATHMLTQINDIARVSGVEAGGAGKLEITGATLGTAMVREAVSSIRSLEETVKTPAATHRGHLLIVDDNEMNRDVLARQLERQGHTVATAETGSRAFELIGGDSFDLLLLDVLMPGMSGFQVLERLKTDPDLRAIPVIMISSLDELDSVVRCIEMGAEDYLAKPFNPVLLKARIDACLDKKRLHDREKAHLEELSREREKSERLLLNVLPHTIANRLKERESVIADHFDEATVLFADIVGFTEFSSRMPPSELVQLLNTVFCRFDTLAEAHGLQKIKTIGDAYMVAAGVPVPRPDHIEATAEMALAILREVDRLNAESAAATPISVRVGFHTGPVVAGIIGTTKFSYDLWGDTVNLAHRMESCGVPGRVHLSAHAAARLRDRYDLEERGSIPVKGKGETDTFFLLGRR